MAIGIVIAIVKSPHGEFASAFTTTIAKIATMISMMKKIPIIAMPPVSLPISSLIISPRLLPRRVDSTSTMKSCTAPASTTPTKSQIVPGR